MTSPAASIERGHHIARWSRPLDTDPETGWPKVSAFYLRPHEDSLSVNWLDYFSPDRDLAMLSIRNTFPLRRSPNGRFAVLNVGKALDAILHGGGTSASITHTPDQDNANPSHASIWWDDMATNHQEIAAELHSLLTSQDVLSHA